MFSLIWSGIGLVCGSCFFILLCIAGLVLLNWFANRLNKMSKTAPKEDPAPQSALSEEEWAIIRDELEQSLAPEKPAVDKKAAALEKARKGLGL